MSSPEDDARHETGEDPSLDPGGCYCGRPWDCICSEYEYQESEPQDETTKKETDQ